MTKTTSSFNNDSNDINNSSNNNYHTSCEKRSYFNDNSVAINANYRNNNSINSNSSNSNSYKDSKSRIRKKVKLGRTIVRPGIPNCCLELFSDAFGHRNNNLIRDPLFEPSHCGSNDQGSNLTM